MDVKSEYPLKVVIDHTFTFTSGQALIITVRADEDVLEQPDAFVLLLKGRDADERPVIERTTVFKAHLTTHTTKTRTVVDYPDGQSPAEKAIREIDERNARRIAARNARIES